jgi:hypothetical protein
MYHLLILPQLFEVKQLFIFNMITQCIHTGKGKACVCANDPSLDAQCTYAALLNVYEDVLSTQLLASSHQSELTALKFDEKWHSDCEAFLISLITKAEDRPFDDATKRIWLTTTLRCHPGMSDAVRQATTNELTVGGTSGS